MRQRRGQLVAVALAGALLIAACGNSASSKASTNDSPTSGTPATSASAADLNKFVHVSAPGVTDSEIHVAVITDATNILGGHYKELADGIQAYFDQVNAAGGIYKRQLKITSQRDDKMTANQTEVKASLAQDNAFATFIATTLFTGAPDLAAKNQPTFTWQINPEFAGHQNMFGNLGALCFTCTGQFLPWLAQQNHFTSVGIVGYGVSQESKECAEGTKASFQKFAPDVKIGFFDENVQFAQPDLSAQVSAMKSAGVQLVTTCMDEKETLILAKEMKKQGLNAVQELPNGYDKQFVEDNASYFEGSFVSPGFVPLEKQGIPKEEQDFLAAMQKSGKQIYENTVTGWVLANEFVTGLKLAGPDFSQQKLIQALNGVTSFSANGMIVPLDWTKQHNDPDGHPEFSGKWECNSVVKIESGKFVPVYDTPTKPWICFKGGPSATKLDPKPDYMSFEGIPLNG